MADAQQTASKDRKRSPARKPAADATTAFFQQLQRHSHQPALSRLTGTFRFDVQDGSRHTVHWRVTVDKGDVAVSKDNAAADCIVRADKAVLEDVLTGRKNAMAALLRGALEVSGEPGMMILFQRILPGPSRRRR